MKLEKAFDLIRTYLRVCGFEQLKQELKSGTLPDSVQDAITELLFYLGYYPTRYELIKEDVSKGTLPDAVVEKLTFVISCFRL